MSMLRTYVMTGATSGMGLLLAGKLAREGDTRIIVGARSPASTVALKRAVPNARLTVLPLDLVNQKSVTGFCKAVTEAIGNARCLDAIVCNAGLQITTGRTKTDDGIETTFAANHLGHFLLVDRLLPFLRHGAVVTATASGTHDPNDKLARRFGFRGGLFPSALAVSRGELDASVSTVQQGMDHYATSKLCNILWVKEMSRRIPADEVAFQAFDPGLMPGTGLARDRSAVERFGWTYLLPLLRFAMSGVSTAEKSATAYAKLLRSVSQRFASGKYIDFNLLEITPSQAALREDYARDLYEVSRELTQLKPVR